MATGGMSEIFECAVCLHSMMNRTPRSLQCLHTFCEDCLKPLLREKQVICPTCRKTTNVEADDVGELPFNFLLYKIEQPFQVQNNEMVHKSTEIMCEICKRVPAIFKCEDCPKLLCTKCNKRHSNIYEDHIEGEEICMTHGEIATYICKECNMAPLCEACLPDHQQHKEDIDKFYHIQYNLNEEVKNMKQKIETSQYHYDQSFEKVRKIYVVNQKLLYDLEKKKNYHADIVAETEKLMMETEDIQAVYKVIEQEYEKDRFHSEEVRSHLETFEGLSSELKTLPVLKQQVEDTVNMLQKDFSSEFSLPSFVEKIQDLKAESKHRILKKTSNYGYSVQIVSIGKDFLAITLDPPSHVIRINEYGEVTARYNPEIKDELICSIDVHQSKIYIAQKRTITVLSQDHDIGIKVRKPKIGNICKILVMDKNKILISESANPGKIYLYDVSLRSAKSVVEGLQSPTYLNISYHTKSPTYLVTEKFGNCVKIYSEKWALLHTLGITNDIEPQEGQLSYPQATVVTEQNTVLIADRDNRRVSHFTIDGTFLSHVLTKEDGLLYQPTGILLKNDILYVCGSSSGDIQCFDLQFHPRTDKL